MKLTQTHWIIIGVIIVIAVWYFFFFNKKNESGFGKTISGAAVGTGLGPANRPNCVANGIAGNRCDREECSCASVNGVCPEQCKKTVARCCTTRGAFTNFGMLHS